MHPAQARTLSAITDALTRPHPAPYNAGAKYGLSYAAWSLLSLSDQAAVASAHTMGGDIQHVLDRAGR